MEIFKNFVILILSLAGIFLLIGTAAYAGIIAAPWVPLRKKDVMRVLKLSGVKAGETLYDLGSGDGRIVIAAAKHFGAKSVGFEIAFLPFLYSYVTIFLRKLYPQARVRFRNFFHENLSEADVVVTFLLPKGLEKLKEKYKHELRQGTRVISCAWKIEGWEPDEVDKPAQDEIAIYMYTIRR